MTSTVKVTAHCSPQKQVRITITGVAEDIILEDGESTEQYVYDDREITVKEEVPITGS